MKYLIFLLLMQACGKNDVQNQHEVSTAEAVRDIDQDGISDWREISARSNQHVAFYVKDAGPATDRVSFRSDTHAEELQFQVRRELREGLLRKIFKATSPLPVTNSVALDFSANPLFWRHLLSTNRLSHMQLRSHSPWHGREEYDWEHTAAGYISNVSPLPESFYTTSRLTYPPTVSENEFQNYMIENYRLIISTEGAEHIYFVNPKLPPQKFLQLYFDASFDGLGNLVAMAGTTAELKQPVDWSSKITDSAWWTFNNSPDKNAPQAGDTVSYLHASLQTAINEGSVPTSSRLNPLQEIKPQILSASISRKIKLILHLPAALYNRSSPRRNSESWETYGGRERGSTDRTCYWTEYRNDGPAFHVFDQANMLSFFQFNTQLGNRVLSQWNDLQVLWTETSSAGTTAQIQVALPPGEVSLTHNPDALSGTVTYGVTSSDCRGRGPNVASHTAPYWHDLKASIYWGGR